MPWAIRWVPREHDKSPHCCQSSSDRARSTSAVELKWLGGCDLSKCLLWRVLAEVWSHFDVLGQRHGCCLRDRAGVKRLNGAEEPNRGCFVPFWDIANSFWGTIGGAAGGPQALSGARFRALPRKGPTDSGGVRRAATASSSRACAMNRVARISGHVISSAREMPLGHLETGCSVTCLLRGPADRWLLCS